jgi:hypothetical protein
MPCNDIEPWQVELPRGYPSQRMAETKVENQVGLSEADVQELVVQLEQSSRELQADACPSVFQLLELARTFVNARNTPSDDCCGSTQGPLKASPQIATAGPRTSLCASFGCVHAVHFVA